MRGFLKVIGLLALVVVVLAVGFFGLLMYAPAKKTALMCDGKWDATGQPDKVFAVIGEWRPWVRWISSDPSEGDLHAESHENSAVFYAGYLTRISEEPMTMFRFQSDVKGPMTAAYRASFKELTVQFAPNMVFTGTCTPADK